MKRTEGMVQRIAVRVVCFCFLTPCVAFCQSTPSRDLGQTDRDLAQPSALVAQRFDLASSNSPAEQRRHADLSTPLPDAPSAVIASQPDSSVGVGPQASLPSKVELKTFAANSGLIGEHTALAFPNRALIFESAPRQQDSGPFFRKYFDTSLPRQDSRYHASSKDTLMGRATDAASRIFVTRDEFGKRRINTSYFVGVLTAVAAHSASRPYWARSNSMPLNDFGSTVGNDAGMNLMHEFGPGLRQAVAGHMPSIVFRVEKRILREPSPPSPISSHVR